MIHRGDANRFRPSKYDHRAYVAQLKRRAQVEQTTIFGTAWSPDGRYLLASSNFGEVLCWDFGRGAGGPSGYFSEDYWANLDGDGDGGAEGPGGGEDGDAASRRRPLIRVRPSEDVGALYDLKLKRLGGQMSVIASGDIGVVIYRWSDFLEKMREEEGIHCSDDEEAGKGFSYSDTRVVCIEQVAFFKAHPSATERQGVEINSISVDDNNGQLFAAAGDLFGCYRWDVSTGSLLGTMSHHTDYLHAVHVVNSGKQVLTGGEDGKMGIWDCKSGSLVEMVDCRKHFAKNPSIFSKPNPDFVWGSDTHLWLSGFSSDAGGNWATLCGGAEGSRAAAENVGGFVSTWHLPSRTLSAASAMAESPQAVSSDGGGNDGDVVTTGNRGVVKYWTRSGLRLSSEALSRVKSGYSLSTNPINGAMIVAGSSRFLDCFMFPGSRSFSISV